MKLVNVQSGKLLVEFRGQETIFHNKFLEQEMKKLGVCIPHGMRALFEGRDQVFLGDTRFQEAFKEIYYLTSMNHDLFKWKD